MSLPTRRLFLLNTGIVSAMVDYPIGI